MLPESYVLVAAAALGAAIGSFLNVCIYRIPKGLSLVSPGSSCPHCGAPVAWFDNIPILSWIVLGGRCRRCRGPISVQYPLVEAAGALIWLGAAWWQGATLDGLTTAVFGTLLLGIAITDAKHYLIPDEYTLGGLLAGLALACRGGWPGLRTALVGTAVGFSMLYAVAWLGAKAFRKEAMGGGDIKMMAMVGAFVGWQGTLLTIFLGALLGTVVFVPISLKTKRLVPFGIFLAAGAAVAYLFGGAMIRWYVVHALGWSPGS